MQNKGIKPKTFEMTNNLEKELVLTAIRRRYSQSNGLNKPVIDKITRFHGINEVSVRPEPENANPASSRCFKCVQAIICKKLYKDESEKSTIS